MIINLSPKRNDATLTASRSGDVLTLNGVALDFTALAEGHTLPADAIDSEWITEGEVHRINGQIHLTLDLPHGANAPQHTRFPGPITVTADGPIDLPPHDVTPPPHDAEGPDDAEGPHGPDLPPHDSGEVEA